MTVQQYLTSRKVYNRPQAIMFSESLTTTSSNVLPSGNEFGNNINNSGNFLILSDHNRNPLDFGVQRIENRKRMVNGRMRSYWVADKRTLSVSWDMLPSRSYSLKPNFNTPVTIKNATYNSATSVTYQMDLTTSDTLPFVSGNTVTIKGIISTGNTGGTDNTRFNFNTATIGNITSVTVGTTVTYDVQVNVTGAVTDTYSSGGFMYLSGTSNPPIGDSTYDTVNSITTANAGFKYTIDGGAGGAELLDWYENHYGTFYVFLAYDKFPEFGRDNAAYAHLSQYQEVLEMYITDFTWSVQKRGKENYDMWNINMTLEEA